jgi:hypothetical protein
MFTESIAHLDQSSSPQEPSSSKTRRCSLAQTRAFVHSVNLRWAVRTDRTTPRATAATCSPTRPRTRSPPGPPDHRDAARRARGTPRPLTAGWNRGCSCLLQWSRCWPATSPSFLRRRRPCSTRVDGYRTNVFAGPEPYLRFRGGAELTSAGLVRPGDGGQRPGEGASASAPRRAPGAFRRPPTVGTVGAVPIDRSRIDNDVDVGTRRRGPGPRPFRSPSFGNEAERSSAVSGACKDLLSWESSEELLK